MNNNLINKDIIALQLPTGIGADIGGYAGDFGHIAREFSKYFHVIINPNAVNGGILSAINYDMSYLEGHLFDEFFKGNIGIIPKKPYDTNKIGVIFDSEIPEDILNVHINTINALKMVQGIKTIAIEKTRKNIGIEIKIDKGISYGNVKNPDELLYSAQKLISKGAEAIAVVCYFKDDIEDINYENGQGIDPIGGLEAVISHMITKEFNIPCAHSPAFSDIDISTKIENPKVSSELISSTYLPCIMQGLSIAPKITSKFEENAIYNKNVKYLITLYDAMGSASVLSCKKSNTKLIAVKNKSALDVTPEKLSLDNIDIYETYEECLKTITKNEYK